MIDEGEVLSVAAVDEAFVRAVALDDSAAPDGMNDGVGPVDDDCAVVIVPGKKAAYKG